MNYSSGIHGELFSITVPNDFQNILFTIVYDGNDVRGTKEILDARITIPKRHLMSYDLWEDYGANAKSVKSLMKAIQETDNGFFDSIYDAKHYTFLLDEMKDAILNVCEDSIETRRAVCSFPASHCFESIQGNMRDGQLYITINMRSCNAYKNLMSDLCLGYQIMMEVFKSEIKPQTIFMLTANIGSLHIFEEDSKHVL